MDEALLRTALYDHLIAFDSEHAPDGRCGEILALAVHLLVETDGPVPQVPEQEVFGDFYVDYDRTDDPQEVLDLYVQVPKLWPIVNADEDEVVAWASGERPMAPDKLSGPEWIAARLNEAQLANRGILPNRSTDE